MSDHDFKLNDAEAEYYDRGDHDYDHCQEKLRLIAAEDCERAQSSKPTP